MQLSPNYIVMYSTVDRCGSRHLLKSWLMPMINLVTTAHSSNIKASIYLEDIIRIENAQAISFIS